MRCNRFALETCCDFLNASWKVTLVSTNVPQTLQCSKRRCFSACRRTQSWWPNNGSLKENCVFILQHECRNTWANTAAAAWCTHTHTRNHPSVSAPSSQLTAPQAQPSSWTLMIHAINFRHFIFCFRTFRHLFFVFMIFI